MATLTLIGLYNYDSTLFDDMALPSGIDKTMTVSAILTRSGEFEVLYPEIDFMKQMISFTANKWNRTFTKWYEALQLTYDPIYNYDRYEEWTDNGTDTGNITKHGTDSGTITDSGTDTGTINHTTTDTGTLTNSGTTGNDESSSSSGQTDTLVNAYNNNTLVEDGQSKSTQSATSKSSGTSNNTETHNLSGSDNETRNLKNGNQNLRDLESSNNENRDLATSDTHSGHMYGNIGVTTSQQMLESELELAEWNLYEHIADVFVRELCIPVYG